GSVPWRIDQIWGDGVGILGGPPKCTKSWFGLDMAISLASATPLLGRFQARDPGPALVYLAQDALRQVRSRIAGICQHRHLDIDSIDLHVITAPVVRLDQDADQKRLSITVDRIRPKLLLLDPLVRLHRLDENSSSDISALLGFLREQQRRSDVAIVVVHHMRKAVRSQLGQALRGSADLHAWNDHGVYLTRTGPAGACIRLTLEHRAAPSIDPLELRLVSEPDGSATHLQVVGPASDDPDPTVPLAAAPSLNDRIWAVLRGGSAPISRAQLRATLRINNNRIGDAIAELERAGRIRRTDNGIRAVQ
ncbi:MAG: helicase RepA family protein, partial [Polyangiaceae bacterium]|nr:helicase RepA family protein [Polyangiaceae bacterium]